MRSFANPTRKLSAILLMVLTAVLTIGVALAQQGDFGPTPELASESAAPSVDLLPRPNNFSLPSPEDVNKIQIFQENAAPIELERASGTFPYQIKLPSYLPVGSTLAHVMPSLEAVATGGSVYSLGVWFALPTGGRIHIWQTNGQLTEKDPVTEPSSTAFEANGRIWQRVETDFEGLENFSTRFADGVTVSVDFPVSEVDAKELLASFR